MWAIILAALSPAFAADAKESPAVPLTTKNPTITIEELKYRLEPLSKDAREFVAGRLKTETFVAGGIIVHQGEPLEEILAPHPFFMIHKDESWRCNL